MREITDYLDDTYGKAEIDTGKLWQEIMRGNLQGSINICASAGKSSVIAAASSSSGEDALHLMSNIPKKRKININAAD